MQFCIAVWNVTYACSSCRSSLDIQDVSVGEDKQQFMHTISAGDQASPPMVVLPGYGAGSGFYFRNIDGLAKHFRLHCVDLLGTGMSGALPFGIQRYCDYAHAHLRHKLFKRPPDSSSRDNWVVARHEYVFDSLRAVYPVVPSSQGSVLFEARVNQSASMT